MRRDRRLDSGKSRRIVDFGDARGIELAAQVNVQVLLQCHGALQTLVLKRERWRILVLTISREEVAHRALCGCEVAAGRLHTVLDEATARSRLKLSLILVEPVQLVYIGIGHRRRENRGRTRERQLDDVGLNVGSNGRVLSELLPPLEEP